MIAFPPCLPPPWGHSWPPPAAGAASTRPCGSCARRGAACRSTGQCAATGSILDALKQPDLAAEITLQPVRRYGVDAAVLYSDIVVPPHAVGFGIDVAPGTGPVAVRTAAHAPGPRPAAPARARRRGLRRRDGQGSPPPSSSHDGAPARLRRCPVHRRQLPDRGPAEPDVRAHQGADANRRGDCGTTSWTGWPTHGRDFIDVQLTHGAQAFQLFDSWAGTLSRPDYERFVLPHSRRVFAELAARHPAVPGIHFGIGCDHLLESMWAAGPQRHRARLAHVDQRCPAPSRAGRRRAGQPRPGARARRRSTGATPAARAVLADNGGHPGHVFNLGHGVQPDSDPGVLAASSSLVHAETRVA